MRDKLIKVMTAEQAFDLALRKRYGKAAGDMRYLTAELPEDIRALALAYQRAVAEWQEAR